MPEGDLLERPKTQTGGQGTTTRGGGGGFGAQGESGGSGATADDDFFRLAAMLERIRDTLEMLIYFDPPILPTEIQPRLAEVWPETKRHLDDAINGLRNKERPAQWRVLLESAGLTGLMLNMKATSLKLCLDNATEQVQKSRKLGIAKRVFKKAFSFLEPAFDLMNAVMGSIPAAVFPGKEIVKEVKDNVAAGCKMADAAIDG